MCWFAVLPPCCAQMAAHEAIQANMPPRISNKERKQPVAAGAPVAPFSRAPSKTAITYKAGAKVSEMVTKDGWLRLTQANERDYHVNNCVEKAADWGFANMCVPFCVDPNSKAHALQHCDKGHLVDAPEHKAHGNKALLTALHADPKCSKITKGRHATLGSSSRDGAAPGPSSRDNAARGRAGYRGGRQGGRAGGRSNFRRQGARS